MKNKEIEELLNTFKELINTYSPDTEPFEINYDYEIKYSALESLLSYIEQLENNRDKAIEYLKFIQMDKTDKYIPLRDYKEFGILMNILKGDSDE